MIKKIKFKLWRILKGSKYDKKSNKIRKELIKEINKLDAYCYIGFGTILKLYRDGQMKNQDFDVILDRKDFEANKHMKMVEKFEGKLWQEYHYDGRLVIIKYMTKYGCPIEFFISDDVNNMEESYHFWNDGNITKGMKRVIDKQELVVKELSGVKFKMPVDIDKYIIDVYGENYNKPIKTGKYKWYRDTNTTTLFPLEESKIESKYF